MHRMTFKLINPPRVPTKVLRLMALAFAGLNRFADTCKAAQGYLTRLHAACRISVATLVARTIHPAVAIISTAFASFLLSGLIGFKSPAHHCLMIQSRSGAATPTGQDGQWIVRGRWKINCIAFCIQIPPECGIAVVSLNIALGITKIVRIA